MSLEIAGIFTAGLLTLFTPCVLPLIPVYLVMLASNTTDPSEPNGLQSRLSLLSSTALFSLGLVVVFVALGLTATTLGALLAEHRTDLVLIGGLVIFLFGLKFLGVLNLAVLDRERRLDDRRLKTGFHPVNSLVMGAVFGLGWTPCIGPILGSVLTYTASSTADPWQGTAYLTAYGLGFTLPLMVLSLFADVARQVVRALSRWLPRVEKISGVLLLIVGLSLMLGASRAPSAAVSRSSSPVRGVIIEPPLGEPTSRPRMAQFTSRDCSVCRQMIPTVAVIERDCDGRNVDIVKVDVGEATNRRTANEFRVRGVPTFVFLDESGNEVARLVGYQTLASLRQSLAVLVGEQCDGLGLFPPDSEACEEGVGAQCEDEALEDPETLR